MLIYEQQEGRGIGLMEKLRAYELQDVDSTRSKRISTWAMRSTLAITRSPCRFSAPSRFVPSV